MSKTPLIQKTEVEGLPSDVASNCTDNQSEGESISEEERVRRLFVLCDADGDGFIDSHDLVTALQELGLDGEVDVEDLMQQMGADASGRVTYEQFLQCRLSHKSEIDALKTQNTFTTDPISLQWMNAKDVTGMYGATGLMTTSSEQSLGTVSGRQESWEFDSGARDLSPEPHSLHKLIEAAGGSLHGGSTSSLLDLANKLHLAALSSLKNEIAELHGRLQRSIQERDTLEQALATTQLERLRLVQESEERLERQSTQYEERLTELHSVIAELTRKLNRQQYNVIKEEGEEDEEEDDKVDSPSRSRSGGSRSRSDVADMETIDTKDVAVENNDHHEADRTNPEVVTGYSRLDREDPIRDHEDDEECRSSCSSDLSFGASSSDDERERDQVDDQTGEDDLDAKAVQAGENLDQFLQSAASRQDDVTAEELAGGDQKSRRGSLEEHLMALSAENRELKIQLKRMGVELAQARQVIEVMRSEREEWRKKLDSNNSAQPRPLPLSATASMGAVGFGPGGSPINRVSSPVVVEEGPVCKMAERVRIKRLEEKDKILTGSQIASLGVRDARVAEQLVSSLHQESTEGESRNASGAAAKVRELELEVERLSSRAEHLRAQNDVLALTLSESRAMGERLAVLLGKYESNCIALKLALERADRVSEAFEVLVALVESEMSLLLANCQMAGIGLAGGRSAPGWEDSTKDWSALWKRATERRRSSENLARCLLARHDKDRDHWDDSGRHTSTTTSSTSSGAESGSGSGSNPGTSLEPTERKVRDIIIRLKADRASLESTIQQITLPLESALVDPLPKEMLPLAEARKMDLEMAVIMQELMAMREERSRLRTQVYLLEKERATSEAQHQTHLAQIRLLQTQMGIVDLCESSQVEGTTGTGSDERERRLQARIQELVSTVDRVTQNAELRHQQSTELVNDVKKANSTLVQLLEKAKKKYQNRLKRMEQQMVNMSERHAMQVRLLKQKIAVMEDGSSLMRASAVASCTPNETSL